MCLDIRKKVRFFASDMQRISVSVEQSEITKIIAGLPSLQQI